MRVSRRKFMLASVATVGVTGSQNVSAGFRTKGPSIQRVHESIIEGMKDSGPKGGKEQLEDIGLNAGVQTTRDFQVNERALARVKKNQTVQPAYSFEDPETGDSEFSLIVGGTGAGSKGEVYITPYMSLDGCSRTMRNSWWVDDAIGVGFVEQDWAPVGEPSVAVDDPHNARYTAEDVADDALAGSISIKNDLPGDPALCSGLEEANAGLTGKFRLRTGGEPSTLWGSYSHTFAGSPSSSIDSITGGNGGLEVDVSLAGTTYWSIAEPLDAEDYI